MSSKRHDKGTPAPKRDKLSELFGSLRSGRTSMSPTTETVEKHLTSGPLAERTDLFPDDVGGIVFLEFVADQYGIPEAAMEAKLWKEHFISKGRMGRIEDVDMVKAKIQRELEIAEIRAKAEASGRERK